jgi:hypothetical protein
MGCEPLICESYEFVIGDRREVAVCFDFPVGIESGHGAELIEIDLLNRLVVSFGPRQVVFPDITAEMAAALARAPAVTVVFSYADGSVRQSEAVRGASWGAAAA